MRRIIFSLVILLNCLLIESLLSLFSPINTRLIFRYYSSKFSTIPVNTREVLRTNSNNNYFFTGKEINDGNTLLVKNILCVTFANSEQNCTRSFKSSYLFLEHLMNSDDYLLRINDGDNGIKTFLRDLPLTLYVNLTCTIGNPPRNTTTDKAKGSDPNGLSKTTLFAIIFLGACTALIFCLCIGWFSIIYYQRFEQYRMKRKLRKALAKSTQQMLDKSPIIIFDSDNKDNDNTDDEPMCAICLESFKNKEKLRKLVCSHCFHLTCIDPWILSHQNCPLCNRNILRSSIPSISSSIMVAINEYNNDETSSIASNRHRTIQAQNSNL